MKNSLAEILIDEDKFISVSKTGLYEYTEFKYSDFVLNVRKDRFNYPNDLITYLDSPTKANLYKKIRSRRSYIDRWNKIFSSIIWSELGCEFFEKTIYDNAGYMIANLANDGSDFFWLKTKPISSIETKVSLDIYKNSIQPLIYFLEDETLQISEIRLEPLNKWIGKDVVTTFINNKRLLGYTCIYIELGKERLPDFVISENNVYFPYMDYSLNGYIKCAVFSKKYWGPVISGIEKDYNVIINKIDKELKDVK
ncbi:hypothetical protein [Mesotoga prima]|uniref:hypothetical protein n=1 Tax=Mesotoga prima TaxID=1184387 RepID=UPI002FDB882E